MARVYGELYSITKLKDGGYRVHLLLDDDGIEEETSKDYPDLASLPRFLFNLRDGKLSFIRGMEISIYMLARDVYGIMWSPDSLRAED